MSFKTELVAVIAGVAGAARGVLASFALRQITGQDFEVGQDSNISVRRSAADRARRWWDRNRTSPQEGVSLVAAEKAARSRQRRGFRTSSVAMQFRISHFDDLTPREVYDMLRLRAEVFVVEQECAYVDPDGEDLDATHLLASENGVLCGYARWYEEDGAWRIGRVVTHPDRRGEGLGHDLMRACLAFVGDEDAFLHSQVYVQAFYAEHGFVPEGETFLEDDIPHVLMRRRSGK